MKQNSKSSVGTTDDKSTKDEAALGQAQLEQNPMLADAFSQPMEVTSSTNIKTLLPKMNDIPDEFGSHFNKWNKAVSTWFFKGIRKDAFTVKEGIDANKAFKHLAAVVSSWDLKHEHKTAGAAYLMSLWFSDVSVK